ncbi:MAG: hypothetical protein JW955_21035 [Sedimentisphaerales bacterium]|nr:hypothetical protein [Sedimentisphaerales bacterium]
MRKRLFYGTILTAILVGLCMAAPKPAILQKPGQWTMEVRFEHPQQIVVPWGAGGQSRFWYMILTVTNRSGRDVEFYPKCDLMTDTFQVLPAGQHVPPVVFQQIRQRHGSVYQFLEPLERVENRILQGEDNAKEIVIAWQDFDPQAASFKVFVSGLSNETAVVRHPVAVNDAGRPVQVFLRKTLELNYSLQGDPTIRPSVQTVYASQSWIMR